MLNQYIYIHIRLDTNRIFYVGKGKDKRAYSNQGRNTYWHNIVNSAGYRVEILYSNLSESEAFEREVNSIKANKYFGFAEANLTLSSNCGGPVGATRSEETRKKMRESKMGDNNPMKNPETVEKMRQAKLVNPNRYEIAKKASARASLKKAIKIIDIVTGQIYISIKEASKNISLSYSQLAKMLAGKSPNHTNLRKVG